ncbi:hypothetical protein P168DRAFT_305816 [Aspergillus campestris IBT 28561]|uniref:Telomere replication protein EST3 n=1 Tax=Aspergillus campestris (strain IBT 28561) TaxID=1392248 RepID=A0A2I1CY30_ASPC2|nr:uncharacterized protein P168DRAFT_305816 [Aspergillus campestris IBT 28561]PKY02523.1 hypothetical protein P168DRAFT_305816 [Aspergillus campestris IBT 28561]
MESIQPWIGPLIERSLSLYSHGQLDDLEVEDDGSNLRFKVPSGRHAMITAWDNMKNWSKARITDQLTQLDAIISEESLEVYNRSFPHRPVDIKEARGCSIRLLDFEMVLEYAASSPGIHLYVKRFDVAWEGFRYKGPVPGRLPKKSKELMELVNQAFKHAKSAGKGGQVPKDPRFLGSPGSLKGHAPQAPGTQSVLMSQVPSDLYGRNWAYSSQTAPLPVNSDQLLGHLGGGAHVSQNGSPSQAPPEIVAQPNRAVGTDQTRGGDVSIGTDSRPSAQDHVQLPDPVSVTRLKTPDRNTPGMGEHTRDKTEECTNPAQNPDREENVEKHAKSPAQTGASKRTLTDSEDLNSPKRSRENPWEGMTMISKKDVEIPKDQRKLFEQHLRRWIPASPGRDEITGNVPPALLHQWNQIALKRHRMAQQPGPRSSTPNPAISHDAQPDTPNRSPEPDPESDEGSPCDWSISNDASPSRGIPADSSPVREIPRGRRGDLRWAELDSTHNQPEADAEPEQDIRMESPPKQGHEPKPDMADGDTGIEDTRAHIQETHESDNESDDSTMETSVPCALGSNSQQTNPASQPENGVNSSGSAHEQSVQEHVQVMETPANKRRAAKPKESPNHTDSNSQPSGQPSSSGPESSQSRILNTYASNNGDPERTEDTNVSIGSEDGSNNANILGTQSSTGHWSMQETTFSQSDMLLDPSVSRNREQSVGVVNSTCQSEESSKPFSSYREVLHSTQSEDIEDASGPSSSLPDLLVEHARRLALKRGISEVDNDLSMAKRFKAQHDEDHDVSRSVSDIVTRRQSYISGSPEHFEAQRIHEKFRRAYPSYTGDFLHFTELCSMLRSLRSQGNLTRSFLWDDFIIKHLQDYPQHREQSSAAETKTLPYEEFFLSTYNKPSYKKRDLTVKSIEVAAAQYVPLSQSSPVHQADAKVSFTGSLVDRFSNFHAHSFGPSSQSAQTDLDIDRMPSTQSTDSQEDTQAAAEEQLLGEVSQASAREEADPERSGLNKERRTAPPNQHPEEAGARHSPSPTESHYDDAIEEARRSRAPDGPPNRSASASESESCYKDAMDETRSSPAGEIQVEPDHQSTIERSIPESVSESIYDDPMDETHETASIELGDDEDNDAGPSSTADAKGLPSQESEPESDNENWFDSLHHIWERSDADPPWSDDRNTPFKTWARETLNVKSEVKRRGWAYAVDERGVVQRPR